jgi:hypothetical protein
MMLRKSKRLRPCASPVVQAQLLADCGMVELDHDIHDLHRHRLPAACCCGDVSAALAGPTSALLAIRLQHSFFSLS